MSECAEWLDEARAVFPALDRKVIVAEYRKMSCRFLGKVGAKVSRKVDFDAAALMLGLPAKVQSSIKAPDEFAISINAGITAVRDAALRKEVVQSIMAHELMHIEMNDLVESAKDYGRRKRKKFHVAAFEEEVLRRYNALREKRGVPAIAKMEHLNMAVHRILSEAGWQKGN